MSSIFEMFSDMNRPARAVTVVLDGALAAECARIHATAFAHSWSAEDFGELLADRRVVADGAAHAGAQAQGLTGFVLSRNVAGEAEILTLAVDAANRGRGLGQLLLSRHLARLAEQGVRCILLEADAENGAALALYRKHRFVEVGTRKAYYPRRDGLKGKALILRRDLA